MGIVKDALSSRQSKSAYYYTKIFISFLLGGTGYKFISTGMLSDFNHILAGVPAWGVAVIVFLLAYWTVADWIAKILRVFEYVFSGK